jgi:hypothetical protein
MPGTAIYGTQAKSSLFFYGPPAKDAFDIILFFGFFAMLGIEHKASFILGKCSATELHSQPWS